MKINEIFYSLQGEGKWTGLPNVFIRTTGCNLRCLYCDTKYAYEEGIEKTIEETISEAEKYSCKKICISGGEPLIQKDTIKLINKLIKKNYKISLETNGSIDITPLTNKANLMISLDIKCPSSKMHGKMIFKNIKKLKQKDQLKLIIKNKNDYEYAKKIINKYRPPCTIFFQPVWKTNTKHLADWILKDGLNVKLGLQIHKIIWENKRGI